MAEPHRVAVVGLGIGQMHVWSLRRMKDRYTVAAVCDLDPVKTEEAAARTGADVVTFDPIVFGFQNPGLRFGEPTASFLDAAHAKGEWSGEYWKSSSFFLPEPETACRQRLAPSTNSKTSA